MGTPENLVPGAVQTMRWLILLPVVLAWHEWNIGHLMLQRHTPVLFVGKAVNVSLVALTVGPGFKFLTGFGAAGGAVATLLGHTGEGLVLTAGSWVVPPTTVPEQKDRGHNRRLISQTRRMSPVDRMLDGLMCVPAVGVWLIRRLGLRVEVSVAAGLTAAEERGTP